MALMHTRSVQQRVVLSDRMMLLSLQQTAAALRHHCKRERDHARPLLLPTTRIQMRGPQMSLLQSKSSCQLRLKKTLNPPSQDRLRVSLLCHAMRQRAGYRSRDK